jgi:hypothetical protein
VRDRRNGQWWRSDRPWMRRHQPYGSHRDDWVRVTGSEAGRGVGAAGETPTMGVVVESRTDANSTSRLARWTACWRGPLRGSGSDRPQGALRAIDASARPRSWRTFGPRRLRQHFSLPWLPRTVVRQSAAQHAAHLPRPCRVLPATRVGDQADATCHVQQAHKVPPVELAAPGLGGTPTGLLELPGGPRSSGL